MIVEIANISWQDFMIYRDFMLAKCLRVED